MTRSRAGARSGDRGVTAVIFALMIGGMVTMTAFAVDIGRAFTERRIDQNAVDAAAMSAAVESVYGDGSLQSAIDEAIARVDDSLGITVPTSDWVACTDSSKLPRTAKALGAVPSTECISFSPGYDEIRVRVPDQHFDTTFASVIGVDSLSTQASANAEIVPPEGAGAPPFIALEGAQKGDFVCLRTGGPESGEPNSLMDGRGPGVAPAAGVRPDPCNSSQYPTSSSAFGTIKPHAYEDACQQRNQEIKLAIAVGMDHLLGVFEGGFDTVRQDLDGDGYYEIAGDPDPMAVAGDGIDSRTRVDGYGNCVSVLSARPNTLEVDTGFAAQDLKCALLSPKNSDTCENEYPRLRPAEESTYPATPLVVGERLSNVPPWNHLLPAATLLSTGAPDSCVIVAASRTTDGFLLSSNSRFDSYRVAHPNWQDGNWDPYDRYDMFMQCMQDWEGPILVDGVVTPQDPELFLESIGSSPRFAFIPQVHESTIVNGQDVHIEGWLPVYLHRLYISVNNQPMCGTYDPRPTKYWIHDSGNTWSCGNSNDNVDRLSSVVLACGMVSDVLCNKETLIPLAAGNDIYDFRLVR